ncbi:MAG: insulinase family protein [Tibeticola sp.]|nr:insulinase family protein [Tibeticola sp.]
MTMKKRALPFLFTLAIGLFLSKMAVAGLPVERWTLPTGARVSLVQSPAIPMVDVRLDFDAGSRRDPAPQAGLAQGVALMLAKGVAARGDAPALDENQLGEAWADLGASLDAQVEPDRLSLTLRSLTEPDLLARAAALAARQIAEPAFDPAVWARERARYSADLREAATRPATVTDQQFMPAIYGRHPYGQFPTPETLARIEAADLRAAHARGFAPCHARISIVGALDRPAAERLVQQLLARLDARSCPSLPELPAVEPLTAAREIAVPFGSAQAHVRVGQPGIARSDPDYFPLLVGNYILGGGGFVSRLMEEVRQKRGLSYSVYSDFQPLRQSGPFVIGLQTRPDQAAQAVGVVRQVVADFVAKGPTAEELEAAQRALIAGFPLRIDSNRKLLDNIAAMAWYDLPADYLDTWTERVQAVTLEQIRSAVVRVLKPQAMVTVVVGGTER